ncbi:MAG: replication-associated recombination protein A [Gammaproteobacteria bacterium]|nr:replication-associated recombination protein A [Gammaproteobacteria bacterium]
MSGEPRAPDPRPLADRLRPQTLDEVVGQAQVLGPGKPLRRALEAGQIHSLVLWGPPGTGKTTIAQLIARRVEARFIAVSAVLSGVKEIRAAIEEARSQGAQARRTVVFVDEVHRFNKAQQDAFLPHIEDGTITFVGATTENPAFELNNALLSRLRIYVLQALTPEALVALLLRAAHRLQQETPCDISPDALSALAAAADGDARRALNLLELAVSDRAGAAIDRAFIEDFVGGAGIRRFDKGGDVFYDQISALHKSVRGTDPDGALYWYARLLDGGCDPLYVARRVVRMATEDIGIADPRALQIALAGWDTFERLGAPEGELAIAQAVVYCAVAAKSNAVYAGLIAARADIQLHGSLPVPDHLRNAPTALARALGHGRGYRYDHAQANAHALGQTYLPPVLAERRYYQPVERGLEQKIAAKLRYLRGEGVKPESSDGA